MTGKAFVCRLSEPQKIEGADNIVFVEVAGETIITSVNNTEGTEGILFDCESVIDSAFLSDHNLFRHSELNADKDVVGYFEDSGRVRPLKLRGKKCSAFFMPLDDIKWNTDSVKVGDQIESLNSKPLCRKFVNTQEQGTGRKPGKAREILVPDFKEHFSTDQLERSWSAIKGDIPVIVSAKLHGTSCRCGFLPAKQSVPWYKRLFGIQPKTAYKFTVGSRRVVKYVEGADLESKKSFYKDDIWTLASKKYFYDKLNKGETIYFEIVGYLPDGSAIMPGHKIEKLKPFMDKPVYKEWKNHYGTDIKFSYGCAPKEFKVFVYRISYTTPDGFCFDLSWDHVKMRCQQLGVPTVPELCRISPPADDRDCQELISTEVETQKTAGNKFGIDYSRFKDTPIEGVCVRQDAGFVPTILKSKTYEFKTIESIIKATNSDIEENN